MEAPTPMPAFAPVLRPWDVEEWVGGGLTMVFAVGDEDVDRAAGLEVKAVEDTGGGGGDVFLALRRLQSISFSAFHST